MRDVEVIDCQAEIFCQFHAFFPAKTRNNNEEFLEFANMLINRSQFNFNTTINENDFILTLSTCYNDTEKMVIHAKLIKKETR